MTNIAKDFEGLWKKEHRSVATILTDYGQGRYEAQTEAGYKLIVTGSATVGEKVFYDVRTKKVLEQAPDVTFFDIPV